MLAWGLVGALLVAQVSPDQVRLDAARRELAEVAARIESLKASTAGGGAHLERLLVRSQELASEIERMERPGPARPAPAAPEPQELREQADALRDQADRLSEALRLVEQRLREERRRRELERRLESLSEQGALFDEAAPGRLSGTRGGGSVPAVPGTTNSPPTGGDQGRSGPLAGAFAPSRPTYAALAPGPRDDERALRRKRDEILRSLALLRERIAGLEAEVSRQVGGR
ncbi:MAG TPA: hypothetical protein VIV59_03425 [Anaeromyxobacteraceae bacterium]